MPLTLSRSLLVVLIPGIVACAPWILLCAEYAPGLSKLYRDYQVPGNALLFALVVVMGSIVEGLGTRFEVRWDREREKQFNVRENWYKYLAQTPKVEPVGFRYISRTVTTMYFELSMAIAGPSMIMGLGAIFLTLRTNRWLWIESACIAIAVFTWWFFSRQARDSHQLLCEVRVELANRLRNEGPDAK